MVHLALVAIGGAIGAGSRHLVNLAALRLFGPAFPVGTLAVNVIGGLLMGLLAGYFALKYSGGGQGLRLFLATGILGGFTTFSAFSLDAVLLWERGRHHRCSRLRAPFGRALDRGACRRPRNHAGGRMKAVETKTVDSDEAGIRLDRWFKLHYPGLGFGHLQKLIRSGQVRVDGARVEASARLAAGQQVRVPPLAATDQRQGAPTSLRKASDREALEAVDPPRGCRRDRA